MKKVIKMIGWSVLIIILLIVVAGVLFLNLSPQFGKGPNKIQKEAFSKFENYKEGKFVNESESPMDVNFWKMMKEFTKEAPSRKPSKSLTLEQLDFEQLSKTDQAQLIWFGHSTCLLIIDNKSILLDPMFGDTPSPLSFMGTKRFTKDLLSVVDQFPFIDAVILSHDHYDHLDYGSIQLLKDKVGKYYTPLGVGNHLKAWGVDSNRIHELNWWDTIDFEGIHLTCTPARHFSGRGMLDRASTLWCSWVIKGAKESLFFSGDSGYDLHFKKIGDKYGPFDLALMECGQYNEDWKYIHMMPEETAQAASDVKAKLVLPIHWGGFTLAFHDWTDPVERLLHKAKELSVPVATPKIGEVITLGSGNYPVEKWWLEH